MPRVKLSDQLDKFKVDANPPTPMPATEAAPQVQEPSAPGEPAETPQKATAKSTKNQPTPGEAAIAMPPYLRLIRKETRIREDQYEALTGQARRLNRAKGTGGERITENTLIRVAIDLLLTQIDQLRGSDESELRNSVTSKLT